MNIGIKVVGIIIIISLISISCTQKKNIVGTGGSGENFPLNATLDHNSFSEIYSYEDSCSYNNSNIMSFGNYSEETSYSLLRFTSLPDTSYEISSVNISLEIKDRHNFAIVDNSTLKLAKINDIKWYENATWWISSDSTDWDGEHFSELNYTDLLPDEYEVVSDADSINISLDPVILEEWINEDVNSGLVIYSDNDDSFMEIYTSEYANDKYPVLTFEFRETEEDTLVTETIATCYDCSIYETDNNYEKWPDELKLSNIQPINIFTKFYDNALETSFINALPSDYVIENADTALFLQRITINKAELVLSNNGMNAYPLDTSISISPFFVTADTINLDLDEVPLLTNDDISDLYISSSTDTINSDHFTIDITRVIQYYISNDEYENHGIVLKSLSVNDNFIHTEFDLEPEINIIFTPPFLED